MTRREQEEAIVDDLSRRMFLAYCEKLGSKPGRNQKKPPAWATEYAEIAVDYLGYPEDLVPGVSA